MQGLPAVLAISPEHQLHKPYLDHLMENCPNWGCASVLRRQFLENPNLKQTGRLLETARAVNQLGPGAATITEAFLDELMEAEPDYRPVIQWMRTIEEPFADRYQKTAHRTVFLAKPTTSIVAFAGNLVRERKDHLEGKVDIGILALDALQQEPCLEDVKALNLLLSLLPESEGEPALEAVKALFERTEPRRELARDVLEEVRSQSESRLQELAQVVLKWCPNVLGQEPDGVEVDFELGYEEMLIGDHHLPVLRN